MADEATDASNKGQLAVCIRYVKSNTLKIEERFLGFSECETSVSGQAIAAHFLQLLETWHFLLLSYVAKHMMVLVQWQERLKEQLQESPSCIQKHYTHTVHLMYLICVLYLAAVYQLSEIRWTLQIVFIAFLIILENANLL